MNLRVDLIGDTPSFVFLWSGSGISLQWGRACLRKWGYRRCEDICWIKSNRETGRNHDWLPDSVITSTTEHCLVGIKGTVRRNYDGHIIHANVSWTSACAMVDALRSGWRPALPMRPGRPLTVDDLCHSGGHRRNAVRGAPIWCHRQAF